MSHRPLVSFLISTHNRREVLLHTLERLYGCGLGGGDHEIIVVDNNSDDHTADAVAARFPHVLLLRSSRNRGACARNRGLAVAAGEFVVFLDDDSFPQDARCIRQMIQHFRNEPELGAAIFNVLLPDGSRECSAYPSVFIGCGTGFRRDALVAVGGLSEEFFMQAEEYDLALKLLNNGWHLRRFPDLQVTHLKTPNARNSTRTTRLDVRNNLTVIARHFPRRWVVPFAIDWTRRYWWIASSKGLRHQLAFARGLLEGLGRSLRCRRKPVSDVAFEEFAMVEHIEAQLRSAARRGGWKRVLLIDIGKNILPFWLGAQSAGLQVVAVADPRLAAEGRWYRGVPVIDDDAARKLSFDVAIVANSSPVHVELRTELWRKMDGRRVVNLFEDQATPERSTAPVRKPAMSLAA